MNDLLSPVPKKKKVKEETFGFIEAINQVKNGEIVRRLEWSDPLEYCLLKDSFLMIHRGDKFYQWIVSEGDMMAIDWVVKK